MKHFELLSAGVLLILLGTVVPTFAQERHEEQAQAPKQEQAKPEKQTKPVQQKQQKQQPQQAKAQQKQQPQQAKAQQKQQKAQPAQAKSQQNQQKAQQQAKGQQQQQKVQQQQQKVQQQQQAKAGQQQGTSQRPQRTPQAESKQRGEPALRLSARGQGRIPDDRFRSNFGRGHEFRIGSPRMVDGYSRFQYGGFWFGFVQPWPDGWYYTDDVYIDYVDGEYFLFNPYYPGVRIAVNVVL